MATKEDIERKYDIRCDFISEGDSVLIRLPSLQEKVIKLSKNGFVGSLKRLIANLSFPIVQPTLVNLVKLHSLNS